MATNPAIRSKRLPYYYLTEYGAPCMQGTDRMTIASSANEHLQVQISGYLLFYWISPIILIRLCVSVLVLAHLGDGAAVVFRA